MAKRARSVREIGNNVATAKKAAPHRDAAQSLKLCKKLDYMPAIVPTGKVSAITHTQMPKITAKNTVRRSKFFSHTPEPAVALYIDAAIMSETPVPLPECIRTKMIVRKAEMAIMIKRAMLRGPTI